MTACYESPALTVRECPNRPVKLPIALWRAGLAFK